MYLVRPEKRVAPNIKKFVLIGFFNRAVFFRICPKMEIALLSFLPLVMRERFGRHRGEWRFIWMI